MGRHNEYQPQGGDTLQLGSKNRYGSCVGDNIKLHILRVPMNKLRNWLTRRQWLSVTNQTSQLGSRDYQIIALNSTCSIRYQNLVAGKKLSPDCMTHVRNTGTSSVVLISVTSVTGISKDTLLRTKTSSSAIAERPRCRVG